MRYKIWEYQTELAPRMPVIPLPKKKEETKPASTAATSGEKKFKWATSLDTNFKFDFKGAIPVLDLSKIDWASTKGVERSESGAEGVFFVQTGEGAVVIKGSKSMAGEVFSSLLTMYFGISVPKCRILKNEGEEAHLMLESLKKVDPSWRIITNLYDLVYLLLKEFVHGEALERLDWEKASDIFGEGGELSENGKLRLQELGALVVIDMLTNNGDRFPIPIWGNQGNAGNVMFSPHLGTVMSIDSQIMAISPQYPEELQQYLKKVDTFVQHVIANDNVCVNDLGRISGFILNICQYDIGSKGIQEIRKGVLKAIRLVDEGDDFLNRITQWRDALVSFEPPLVGIEKVDFDFVKAVWNVLKSHASQV